MAYFFTKYGIGETVHSPKHGPGRICAVMATDKDIQYAVFLLWKGRTQTFREDEIGVFLKPGPPMKEIGVQVQSIGKSGENEIFVVNNYEPAGLPDMKTAA